MRELETDILIVGGGTGGVAAALAAARNGARVTIVEPTDWLGGQLTSQGVPPDENQWVETFGATSSYQQLREGVRHWYRTHRHLTPQAMAAPLLNPGGGWVSRLSAEPRVWHEVILDMLRSYVASGHITVVLEHEPISADAQGDHVRAVTFTPTSAGDAGERLVVRAAFALDASEAGDLLALAGVEHAIGAEHRDEYGELHGRTDKADPMDQQACSWCFALENRPGENHVGDTPGRYEFWRTFVPQMSDGTRWTGPLFSWTMPSHNAEGRRTFRMVPWPDEPEPEELEMWRYRRIVDRSAYIEDRHVEHGGTQSADVSLINMVQMDYWCRPLLGVSGAERESALREARQQSACWLHWMRTEAPRHDGKGAGYPGLKLRGDELGTADGFAKSVYIREPRRLLARTMLTERHIGTQQRKTDGLATGALNWGATPDGLGTGKRFEDSVGIGHYTIDLHPSCAGRGSVYVPCTPFRVPMGALLPRRVRNVLAAGKCLGVSHVANGATRMHTTEWHIGEAAGTLAAWCVGNGKEPHWVHESMDRVRDIQRVLGEQGVRMEWPWEK